MWNLQNRPKVQINEIDQHQHAINRFCFHYISFYLIYSFFHHETCFSNKKEITKPSQRALQVVCTIQAQYIQPMHTCMLSMKCPLYPTNARTRDACFCVTSSTTANLNQKI